MTEDLQKRYLSRELSWLSFNLRVLQEAEDPNVPLIERLRFLGIYSNNRDEFFRVRVASLKRMVRMKSTAQNVILGDPVSVLKEIEKQTVKTQRKYRQVYNEILEAFKEYGIFIIDEKTLSQNQELSDHVDSYFIENVRPSIMPIMLDLSPQFPYLRDKSVYLMVRLMDSKKQLADRLAVIEVPTDNISRFLVLPKDGDRINIMLLDDVIRFMLPSIFQSLEHDQFEAYAIKLTRDAELDIDADISSSLLEKMERSLEKRKKGVPTRFVYDQKLPPEMLDILVKKMKLKQHGNLIPSGRYHNFKDLMGFPVIGYKKLRFKKLKQFNHPALDQCDSILSVLDQQDVLLHYPYHSFLPEVDLLREASIDSKVSRIMITLYRVASNSNIVRSLINAIKNGKEVVAVVELQARFDEESNLYWSKKLEEAGATVIYGVSGLKVHSKLMFIERKEAGRPSRYVRIGTGNFNGETSKIYTDYSLLTSHRGICKEVQAVFNFYRRNFEIPAFNHLLSSPFNMRTGIEKMILDEIDNAKAGNEAYIILKLNNLVDKDMIDLLYKASGAGVKITLLVRGMCSLKAGVRGLSENIRAISIVGRFLEHSRILIFGNDGNEKMYISSADMMTRNLDHRSEVAVPIYDQSISAQIRSHIEVQLKDNQKARILDPKQGNIYIAQTGATIDSQMVIYDRYRQAQNKP